MSTATKIGRKADKPRPAVPDFCPSCNATGKPFRKVLRNVEQTFRGEDFEVKTRVMECRKCAFRLVAPGQTDELVRAVADSYRQNHDLLTSDEIRKRRAALNLSQASFAKKLNVGVASVKRWEKGFVQDRSNDRLIRLTTDPPPRTEPTRTPWTERLGAWAQLPGGCEGFAEAILKHDYISSFVVEACAPSLFKTLVWKTPSYRLAKPDAPLKDWMRLLSAVAVETVSRSVCSSSERWAPLSIESKIKPGDTQADARRTTSSCYSRQAKSQPETRSDALTLAA